MELPATIALVRRRQLLALGTSLLVHGLGVALLIAPSRERNPAKQPATPQPLP